MSAGYENAISAAQAEVTAEEVISIAQQSAGRPVVGQARTRARPRSAAACA